MEIAYLFFSIEIFVVIDQIAQDKQIKVIYGKTQMCHKDLVHEKKSKPTDDSRKGSISDVI